MSLAYVTSKQIEDLRSNLVSIEISKPSKDIRELILRLSIALVDYDSLEDANGKRELLSDIRKAIKIIDKSNSFQ